ncbi:MAG: GNAT family N-acetyltransferase [Flavobacteriales bacterium]|jgi:GNAT superfamily N-acetyltransferase
MTIQKYEDWMRPQVVRLFDMEYSTGESEFDRLFGSFYEHPFQREMCIRIVAVDGERVAGFQSFFYWPVMLRGRHVQAYQSGNSLVHPDYRGKGLFGKMLNYIHEPGSGFNCELLIGFPVEASYNSFMRNGWLNPFNLQWYIKPMNPLLSFLSNPEKQLQRAWGNRQQIDFACDKKGIAVAQLKAFDDYRMAYETGDFYRFSYTQDEKRAFFEMKAQRRKRVIRELIIGKMLFSHHDASFMREALRALVKEVRKCASFTMMSCAVNTSCESEKIALQALGFKIIERKIYFIAKGPLASGEQDWSSWWIHRSDIDTW